MHASQPRRFRTFNLQSILAGLSAGIVIGILVIFIEVSLAALIFSGNLHGMLSQGIGILLFGAVILGLVVTITSSVNIAIALPQDTPAVILAGVAAGIAAAMTTAGAEKILATVVAAMMFTSLLTGIFFWFLGQFKLGQLVRFIPYPVVGGFLAGTGWLLVAGSIGVMTEVPLSLALLQPDVLLHWLPGVIFAFVLFFSIRRFNHFLLMPVLFLGGIGIFYLILFLSSGNLTTAVQGGWLLGPFPEGSLWQPVTGLVLQEAEWELVISQTITLSTIALVSAISILMNASGLEISIDEDIDLNRELRSNGLGNILAAIGGSSPGYMTISYSMLSDRLGATTRLAGFTSAALTAVALFAGAGILAVFPRVMAGGFLFFIGLSFLVEWIFEAYFKVSKLEYLLIWLILIVIVFFGFLEGVVVGIVVASILFVFNYSRVNVARHSLTGADYQSNVMRPPDYQKLLQEKGENLYILELQGYIFFGTVHSFLEQIRRRVEDSELPRLRFLLLDFRLVTGIDSSATLSMQRLLQMVKDEQIELVLANLGEGISKQWQRVVFGDASQEQWRIFRDLDQGVAWCEQTTIEGHINEGQEIKPQSLVERLDVQLRVVGFKSEDDEILQSSAQGHSDLNLRLDKYVTRMTVDRNQRLLRKNEAVKGLYFVDEGQVIAVSINDKGSEIQLRIMEMGTVFGEIGVYSQMPATADVVASRPSVLIFLSVEKLQMMENEDQQLALAFHRLIVRDLAEKLIQTSNTVVALQS